MFPFPPLLPFNLDFKCVNMSIQLPSPSIRSHFFPPPLLSAHTKSRPSLTLFVKKTNTKRGKLQIIGPMQSRPLVRERYPETRRTFHLQILPRRRRQGFREQTQENVRKGASGEARVITKCELSAYPLVLRAVYRLLLLSS